MRKSLLMTKMIKYPDFPKIFLILNLKILPLGTPLTGGQTRKWVILCGTE